MHPKIKENFTEKLRLTVTEIVSTLDVDIKAMHAKHAAEGILISGNTIKKIMDLILKGNALIYQKTLEYMQSLKISYYAEIDYDIHSLAASAQNSFKKEALTRLKTSAQKVGDSQLYECMLPDLESIMANNLADFQNQLNIALVELKLKNKMSPTEKTIWGAVGFLLLLSVFFVGIWYKNQSA